MTEKIQDPNVSPDSKEWQCGDPYQYPIPEQQGNTWENLLQPLLEEDKARCDAWKDEVQNLLIFAGLFSGVLTAFIIESYQSLQPDPNAAVVNLLTYIANRLDDSMINSTSSASQTTILTSMPSSPTPSSIRVNVFWFISLVLSLTTVLVSIVSMQWLREHQQYSSSLKPRDKFAIFNMRSEALDDWRVPQIISALPLMLQAALVLFFVGLVDFLLALELKVAVPIIIVIGIPLMFLLLTTALPTFQALLLCLPLSERNRWPLSQCAYKSTQSRILLHFIALSKRLFNLYAHSINALYSFTFLLPLRICRLISPNEPEWEWGPDPTGDQYQRRWTWDAIYGSCSMKTWLGFDEEWIFLRDAYAKCVVDRKRWLDYHLFTSREVAPLYDLVGGLGSITSKRPNSTLEVTAYHCVRELLPNIIGDKYPLYDPNFSSRQLYGQYFRRLFSHDLVHNVTSFSEALPMADASLIEEELIFFFLSFLNHKNLDTLPHFVELHIRVMNYMCRTIPGAVSPNSSITSPRCVSDCFLYAYGKEDARAPGDTKSAFNSSISAQFSRITEAFFKTATDPDITDETLFSSFYSTELGDYLRYAIIRQSDDTLQPTVDLLTSSLCAFMDGKLGKRSDFLFFSSSFYARSVLISNPWQFEFWDQGNKFDHVPTIHAFLPVLRKYLDQRGTPDDNLRKRLGIPKLADEWWKFLNCPQEQENEIGCEEIKNIDVESGSAGLPHPRLDNPSSQLPIAVTSFDSSPSSSLLDKDNPTKINLTAEDLV